MMKLRSFYPYGLNDHLGDEYRKKNTHMLVGNKFLPLPRKQERVSRGTIHQDNNPLT